MERAAFAVVARNCCTSYTNQLITVLFLVSQPMTAKPRQPSVHRAAQSQVGTTSDHLLGFSKGLIYRAKWGFLSSFYNAYLDSYLATFQIP